MAKDDQEAVGSLLTLVARRHRTRSAALLQDLGLFPGQDHVLKLLAVNEAVTMSDMAAALHIQPPTASKMVARLSQQGLVERRNRAGDGRMVEVVLTDEGRQRAGEIARIDRQVEEEALDGLDDKDVKRLRKLLKRMGRNLGLPKRRDRVLPVLEVQLDDDM